MSPRQRRFARSHASNLNVSYQDVRSAATRLTTGQDEITTKLNELKAYIASLISSGFVTDQASVAFGESYERFAAGATDVIVLADEPLAVPAERRDHARGDGRVPRRRPAPLTMTTGSGGW